MTTVTCNTDGCENAEEPIEIATPADGEVLVVMCGVCGVEIADIADSPADEVPEEAEPPAE